MKKRKKEAEREETHRPTKQRKTKFMSILKDWRATLVTMMDGKGKRTGHVVEYIVAPNKRIYRRAFAWENPTLVIDSTILPAEHHIRLVRVKDIRIKKAVKRALRRN